MIRSIMVGAKPDRPGRRADMAHPMAGAARRVTAVTCVTKDGPFLPERGASCRLSRGRDVRCPFEGRTEKRGRAPGGPTVKVRAQRGRLGPVPGRAARSHCQSTAQRGDGLQGVAQHVSAGRVSDADDVPRNRFGDPAIPLRNTVCALRTAGGDSPGRRGSGSTGSGRTAPGGPTAGPTPSDDDGTGNTKAETARGAA